MVAAATSDGEGEDRISALPDDALHHILFFLPSHDAVRTSILAQRWRDLWRSTRALRVTDDPRPRRHYGWTASKLTRFVTHFLLLRGATVPVHECDLLCGRVRSDYDYEEELRHHSNDAYVLNAAACLWIRHAVATCRARALRIRFRSRRRLCLDDGGVPLPFASPLPTTVELTDATFKDPSCCIDFSRCPALEDLTMSRCDISSDRILSPSLARLTIDECYFHWKTRTRISTPRLVSLQLSVLSGSAPLLDKMPLLVEANVTLEGLSPDMCEHNVCRHGGGCPRSKSARDRDSCYCIDDNGRGVYLESLGSCQSCCVSRDDGRSDVLEGLSEATDLELISEPRVFIFIKDCNSGPTFTRLRTLLLNEWCLAVNFGALIYFLQYSPVLEKLTLELGHCEIRHPVIETGECYNPKEQLFIVSKQLKMVEIRCDEKNKLLEKLLLLLMTNGEGSQQIQIEEDFSPPDSPDLYGDETNSSDVDDYYW